ncbi:hypothetical protein [Micromonospora sp. NPDC047134]|uniref:hypothetical protein n=1 Tax=Micromonospora sp. NPDC047134 TaxID=3154340 RepID=UPI0033C98633
MTRRKWYQRPDQPVDYISGEPVRSKHRTEPQRWIGRAAVPVPEQPMTMAAAWRKWKAVKRLDQGDPC